MPDALSPVLFSLLAGASLVFGSALPTTKPLRALLTAHRLAMLIGFSAGLMLATALHELLPEALEKDRSGALAGVGIGFLVLYIVERLTHFHACRHRACDVLGDDHVHGEVHTHASTTLMGIGLHNFIDGLITAAAFAVSSIAGGLVLAAIVLHQIAVGFSIGALLLRAGKTQKQVSLATCITGSFILWGALSYAILPLGKTASGWLLGVAAGSFLYIGACDLLPEAHEKDEGVFVMSATVAGYCFVLLLNSFFGHAH